MTESEHGEEDGRASCLGGGPTSGSDDDHDENQIIQLDNNLRTGSASDDDSSSERSPSRSSTPHEEDDNDDNDKKRNKFLEDTASTSQAESEGNSSKMSSSTRQSSGAGYSADDESSNETTTQTDGDKNTNSFQSKRGVGSESTNKDNYHSNISSNKRRLLDQQRCETRHRSWKRRRCTDSKPVKRKTAKSCERRTSSYEASALPTAAGTTLGARSNSAAATTEATAAAAFGPLTASLQDLIDAQTIVSSNLPLQQQMIDFATRTSAANNTNNTDKMNSNMDTQQQAEQEQYPLHLPLSGVETYVNLLQALQPYFRLNGIASNVSCLVKNASDVQNDEDDEDEECDAPQQNHRVITAVEARAAAAAAARTSTGKEATTSSEGFTAFFTTTQSSNSQSGTSVSSYSSSSVQEILRRHSEYLKAKQPSGQDGSPPPSSSQERGHHEDPWTTSGGNNNNVKSSSTALHASTNTKPFGRPETEDCAATASVSKVDQYHDRDVKDGISSDHAQRDSLRTLTRLNMKQQESNWQETCNRKAESVNECHGGKGGSAASEGAVDPHNKPCANVAELYRPSTEEKGKILQASTTEKKNSADNCESTSAGQLNEITAMKNSLITLDSALQLSTTPRIIIQSRAPFLVVHTNAEYSRMTGIDAHMVVGKPITSLMYIPYVEGYGEGSGARDNASYTRTSSAASTGTLFPRLGCDPHVFKKMINDSIHGRLDTIQVCARISTTTQQAQISVPGDGSVGVFQAFPCSCSFMPVVPSPVIASTALKTNMRKVERVITHYLIELKRPADQTNDLTNTQAHQIGKGHTRSSDASEPAMKPLSAVG